LSNLWNEFGFFFEIGDTFKVIPGDTFKHFIWRQQLHLVSKSGRDNQYGLDIFVYDLCRKSELSRDFFFIPMKEPKANYSIKLATCCGDVLHVLLDFANVGLHMYFIKLDTMEVGCDHALGINDVSMMVPSSPNSITCYSFSEHQKMSLIDLDAELTTVRKIRCNDQNLEACNKHFVNLKGKMYCFVENNAKKKISILMLQQDETYDKWDLFGDAPCSLSLQLVFAFKDRVFTVLDKPWKENLQKDSWLAVEERTLWEFDMERKVWLTSFTCEEFTRSSNLKATLIPKHILY